MGLNETKCRDSITAEDSDRIFDLKRIWISKLSLLGFGLDFEMHLLDRVGVEKHKSINLCITDEHWTGLGLPGSGL